MRKADENDLRDALSEEVESLEPSDELWNSIYKRSVAAQEKRRYPWLKGALVTGAAAAAAVFLLTGGLNRGIGPAPPPGNGPVTLVAPGQPSTLPAPPENGVRPLVAPDPTAGRLSVRYNHTMYWYNGESVSAEEVGDLLIVLETGKEVRAIKGSDPVRRIAVQTDQGWYVFDNMLKPLPPNP